MCQKVLEQGPTKEAQKRRNKLCFGLFSPLVVNGFKMVANGNQNGADGVYNGANGSQHVLILDPI